MFFSLLHNVYWPDWIQAIGAVLAAIGLLITFYLQRKTLKEQQSLTRLEQKKYLDNHLPILELVDIAYNIDGQNRKINFGVAVRHNYLRNLKISHNFDKNFEVIIPYYILDIMLPKDYVLKFEISFLLPPVFVEIDEYSGNAITFNFEDVFGNKYEQHLIYKGKDQLFIHPAINK